MAAYREVWQAAGYPAKGKVGLRVPICVNEDAELAYRNPNESAIKLMTRLGDRVGSYAGRAGTLGDWAAEQTCRAWSTATGCGTRSCTAVGTQ